MHVKKTVRWTGQLFSANQNDEDYASVNSGPKTVIKVI